MKNIRFIFIVLAGLLLSAVAAFAAPVMLVDQGHDQRFVIEKDEPLHLSSFAAVMQQEGFEVRSSREPLTEESLKGVAALVISGPFKALEPAEVEAVARFVEHGGRLAAMLHIGTPFSGILQPLAVDFTNYVLGEQENLIDNDSRNFRVKALAASPLFNGLDHFSVYGAWALTNTAPSARIIASTSPKGWVDLNGDKMLSKGDVVQAFGVVVEGTLGAGRFVVFGDDAIFQNRFLDESNKQLARNLARWLK
ncbi:MAG: DUF4350 domain-containing protein [Geobacter sp.]|nr:DUF4350 domain-containing protein [Geobacter sp.]